MPHRPARSPQPIVRLRPPMSAVRKHLYRLTLAALAPLSGVSPSAWAQSTATAAAAAPTAAAAPATTLGEVTVSAQKLSDTEERRYATAGKIVFGREELDRHGDTSLVDVLKRLPGITVGGAPGRGSDIRMRGMGNGYTLILLNGEPTPHGFSLDSLPPEQVERIEIMRAPVAEHSARGIAGIINIVLKETITKKDNQLRAVFGWENGHVQPTFFLARADSFGDFGYTLNANTYHRNQLAESETRSTSQTPGTGVTALAQQVDSRTQTLSDGLHLTSRLNWKLGGGDTFSLQPFIALSNSSTTGDATQTQSIGATPPNYADAHWRTDADNAMVRLMSNWRINLGAGRKLDLRANGSIANFNTSTRRNEYDSAGSLTNRYFTDDRVHDQNLSAAAKYSLPLMPGHQAALGIELERGQREEDMSNEENGVSLLSSFGNQQKAQTRRLATFAQDDWEINPLWSISAGLRLESLQTRSEWAGQSNTNTSQVASPLFHSVWRFDEESKDQIRLSLTRSYKAPTLTQLIARPTLATAYPVSGSNTATSTDTVGNPNLKPELAWGLDLAFEHYLREGGVLSANIFQRNIDQMIRNVTSLQTVSWSSSQRWVTTPENVGSGVTRGIELEAKVKLSELMENAPPLDVRINYSRFWSHVNGVLGPNNRIDQQPPATANLGADYRFRNLPLTLGGNLNWTPAYTVQQTNSQSAEYGLKRTYELYGLWRFNPDTQLRLSAANLLHADYLTGSRNQSTTADFRTDTLAKTYLTWSARLEIKF